MAESLLSATNAVLKRVGLIQGDSGELSSLTDTARQHDIDKIGQVWREVIRTIEREGVFSAEVTEGTLTLVTSTREYALPADFVQMSGQTHRHQVMVNASGNHRMFQYPAPIGTSPDAQMFFDQPDPSDWTGLPIYWALSDRGDFFRVDRTPTSEENGLAFTYRYDTALSLTVAADTFPFSDSVIQELIPVVSHFYKLSDEARTSEAISASQGFQAAIAFATRKKARSHYGPFART